MKRFICITLLLMSTSTYALDGTWNSNGNGNWSDTTKWSGGVVADGAGYTATFPDIITVGRTITVDSPVTIGHITALDVNQDYTIGGASTLTLSAPASSSQLGSPTLRTLTITCPITVYNGITDTGAGSTTFSGNISLGGSQTWSNNVGTITVSNGKLINIGANNLTIAGTGTFTFGQTSSTNATIIGSGNITKTGTSRFNVGGLMANQFSGGTVSIEGGVMHVANWDTVLSGCNITLNGGVLSFYWGATITRTLGTGVNQIQILGGESGFGGAGTTGPSINLGSTVTWGSQYFNPSVFVLGDSGTGNSTSCTFNSKIDLNGGIRTVKAEKGLALNAPFTGNTSYLGASITNSVGTCGLIKTGLGILQSSAITHYINGTLEVREGTLQITQGTFAGSPSVAVARDAKLIFNGSSPYTQAFSVSGEGSWTRLGTGVGTSPWTMTMPNTVETMVVSNAVINVNSTNVFGCKTLYLALTSTLNVNATNVINDIAKVYITTGSGGSQIPLITFGSGAGRTEIIGSLYIDGKEQPKGTYGKTGSGATYINDDIFSNTNGVIRVLGNPPFVIGGKLLVIGGKIIRMR